MIKTAEEGVLLSFGECMALQLMIRALIETHPNPEQLRQKVDFFRKNAVQAISDKPPPNLQLFRFEQVLDQLVDAIPKDLGSQK